jgi:hypothetical protein
MREDRPATAACSAEIIDAEKQSKVAAPLGAMLKKSLVLSNRVPVPVKRAGFSLQRVGRRNGQGCDGRKLVLACGFPLDIGMLSRRVSADDEEIATRLEPHVARAGRQDQTIAGMNTEFCAARAADEENCPASRNTKHLMGARMVMLIVEHPIAPRTLPAVLGEKRLELRRHIPVLGNGVAIDEHRQMF